jgi:hypothetical protein
MRTPLGSWRGGAARDDFADKVLCFAYLIGIYLGISLPLPGGIPLPSVIAGIAGLLLLLHNADRLSTPVVLGVATVLAVCAFSILVSSELVLLKEKFKGLVQFGYSLVAALGFLLAASRLRRHTVARILICLVSAILIGAVMETYLPAAKAVSDAFRQMVFQNGVYAADTRDLALYGRVRPKVFTSEPSFVAFGYTLFAFGWYVVTERFGKTLFYVILLGLGYLAIRGPTILLGLAFVPLYQVVIASRRGEGGNRHLDLVRAALAVGATAALVAIGATVGWEVLQPRIEGIALGRDPSFFGRILAPAIIAKQVLLEHPFAGVGLTGWEALDGAVAQLYATTGFLSYDMQFDGAANSLTNYFWTLWIFMGLAGGTALLCAVSFVLKSAGTPSLLFCWITWIVFGQTVGGFVAPRTWAVLALAAVVSVLHDRCSENASRRAAQSRSMTVEPFLEPPGSHPVGAAGRRSLA